MKLLRLISLSVLSISLCGFVWPTWTSNHSLSQQSPDSAHWLSSEMQLLKHQASNIDENVLRLSLIAYLNAHRRGYDNKQLLTVIDYSKPSTDKRLWVFDLRSGRTLFNTWVSHGKNSGSGTRSDSFSNSPGSLKSSLGVFVTDTTYVGHNGYSLRLRGLEHGLNDNAYNRAIVIHGARYVNPDIISRYGQIGRSWGCPAVSTETSTPLINTIKGDTVVVAYYPDRSWLSHSSFLASV